MKHTVICVCNDIGGMNAVVPVYNELIKREFEAILVTYGRSLERIGNGKLPLRYYPTAEDALKEISGASCLVASMCAARGVAIGRGLAEFFNGKNVPTVAMEDFWAGALLNGEWEPPVARPRYFLVNDELGALCVKKAWGYANGQIKISGFPALDAFLGLDTKEERKDINARMAIKEREKVVLYASSGMGAGKLLEKVVEALNKFRDMGGVPLTFIPREHPMMRSTEPEEIPLWEGALKKFAAGRLIADSSEFGDTNHILPRADLVISHFSTVLVSASVLRKPNIAFLESGALADFKRQTSGLLDDFPLVSLGCTAKAASIEELAGLILQNFETGLGLRAAQEEYLKLDGKNAKRAADFICSLI